MSERWGRGTVRRRSVLGVSLCALLAGCGSGRTSGEQGPSGECVPASEASLSPSVSPSQRSGTTVDIAYFPEDYMADEWLVVSPDGALVAASSIARPGATGNGGAHGVVGGWSASLRSPMNARCGRFRTPRMRGMLRVNNRSDSHNNDTCGR